MDPFMNSKRNTPLHSIGKAKENMDMVESSFVQYFKRE